MPRPHYHVRGFPAAGPENNVANPRKTPMSPTGCGWRVALLALAAWWLGIGAGHGAAAAVEKAPPVAREFSLDEVRLLDGPFKQAMERNARYLLSLEPDRFLHNTREYCGLKPKGALYGGWESRGVAGHCLGHYLTAISCQFAATGDRRFRERIDYIVSEMAECQKAYGDGYIGALPPAELETLRGLKQGKLDVSGGFNFEGGAWVPWYTEHKILAGLLDAWCLGGNSQAKEVTLKLADWVDAVTAGLSPDQQQKMLQVEHGGMRESLVQLYGLTGDERYLKAAQRFYHHAIFDPLLAGRDELTGRHANTQIPKIIGEARAYEVAGDPNDRKIAEFFWNTVVRNRTWVIGGNSDSEHFFPVGKAGEHLGPATAESCNTYNMLKLTEHLFGWKPEVELADFYERALYNHILASQEPEQGMFAYFMSLKPGHFKTYSTPFNSFWCCVGTGMENHTKYNEAIYFHTDTEVYVNLFIPSVLDWKAKGFALEQRTDYPRKEITELTVTAAPATPLTLLIRCPSWAAQAPALTINGSPLNIKAAPGRYAGISRVWSKGDRLRVSIPLELRTETLEGKTNKIAFLYGPLVLAGDFGPAPRTKTFPYANENGENFRAPCADVPVLVRREGEGVLSALKPVAGQSATFRTTGLGRPDDVTLRPYSDLYYERYNVYWDVYSEQEWKVRQAGLQAAAERRKRDEARTVDDIRFGEQQSETDHRLTSVRSQTGDFQDRKWRDARDGGQIEFQMKVLPGVQQALRCVYWGDDADRREFDILVNGRRIATQSLNRNKPGEFFDVDYPLPPELLAGRDSITVRFQAHPGCMAGGFFGCRILMPDR